jgi:hypothetical protein
MPKNKDETISKEGAPIMNYSPLHLHIGWWHAWKKHVANAKAEPTNEGHQRAALIAQAYYVMYSAFYFTWRYDSDGRKR